MDRVRERRAALHDGFLQLMVKRGHLVAPVEISWRRAEQLRKLGYVTVYPFHNRWQGRVEPTVRARDLLASGEA